MRGSLSPAHCVRLAPLLAWCMSLVVGVPAAMAQTTPNFWSIQLDGGLFVPIEAHAASPIVGMRYAKHYNSHIRGGLLTGLTMDSRKLEAPADGVQSRGSVELAQIDTRLVSAMGFMQVDFTERFWLAPFVGIGAGYEWLTLDVKDHRTQQESSANYGNVAWETFAGIGLRLTSRVRVNGELFYNGGSLERHVLDPFGGTSYEAVHVNGVGARIGVDSVFE